MLRLFFITWIPVAAATLGGALAVYRTPGPSVMSAIQHFAAGVVFAAAAGELMPDLVHRGALLSTIFGGACGIGLMLAVKTVAGRGRGRSSLLAITAFDIFVDGLVLGIAFVAGEKEGRLLTLALNSVRRNRTCAYSRAIRCNHRCRCLTTAGRRDGRENAGGAAPELVTGLFSFALMALLYLVTEELLVEAHKIEERPWFTSTFFVGFLLLLLAEEWMAKGV